MSFIQFTFCDHRRDREVEHFVASDIQQKGEAQIFGLAERSFPLSILSFSGASWPPHKENPDEGDWSAYCNDFEKSDWEYFFQSYKFTARKFEDEKEVANSLMTFNLLNIIHLFQDKKHLRS